VAEFSFLKTAYEENSRRGELRPILDREFTHWHLVLNPVFERALHGPGTERGWNFEPAMLVRWKRPASRLRSNTTGRLKALTSGRRLSLRYTS
jgi:hypothetical protein